MLPCHYCGLTFPVKDKLTRHILMNHALETKYRGNSAVQLLHPGLLAADLVAAQNAFLQQGPPSMEPYEQPDCNPMDVEFSTSTSMGVGASVSNTSLGSDQGVVLCKFCGKSFPDVSSLITHLPVHTGDRPFKCEFCGKAFKLRHHMKDHCRVHTGMFYFFILFIFNHFYFEYKTYF